MKKTIMTLVLVVGMALSTGCVFGKDVKTSFTSSVKGLPMVLQTYDEDAQMIDQVKGQSIDIKADGKFSVIGNDGAVAEKSSVLNITVGGNMMMHVGSSMIAYDSALDNVFEEYSKTVDLENLDKSTPFINRLLNSVENLTKGKSLVILIRSQTGKPLATFVGNEIRYDSTAVDKSTSFLVDGKRLFVYRCDYTVYEMDLFN